MKDKLNFKTRLEKNQLGWRIVVGVVLWVSLALFLHFKEIKVPVLDLNTNASKYLVAQIDFEFPDDEATILYKQKHISEIGTIYKVDKKEIKEARLNFEKHLINNANRKYLSGVSYEKINDVADLFENILIRTRFVDFITFKKMKQLRINVKNFITLNLAKEKAAFVLPQGHLSILTNSIAASFLKEDSENVISKYFEKFEYHLKSDDIMQLKFKKILQKHIPQKYTKVKAGEEIIGQKDLVTSKHIAMMNAMKSELRKNRNVLEPLTVLGNFIMAFGFILISIFYFRLEHPKIIKSLKKLSLIVGIIILTLLFAKIIEFILLRSTSFVIDAVKYPIIIPFATLLFSILFNSRISLFFSAFLSIILGINLAVDQSCFLIINLVTSLIVIVSTSLLRKRAEVFSICLKCMLGVIFVILASSFINNRFFSFAVITNIVSSFLFLFLIGVLVVGLLPPLESIFGVLTDITLMEYMDPNNELLRRLTLEIPGSYQHSLVLGNLSEAAALSIGANGLFCRVASLYHDIGKLNNPNYFTENQGKGVNIHQLLTPLESAQVIISHVTDGVVLAKKYRLPHPIIDIIKEHHGSTLVYYFYRKKIELQGSSKTVDETQFRYPGFKPKSKESAIIMISDAVEAASRSLDSSNEKILFEMVEKIVKQKADDSQFDSCLLTFEELTKVKKSLVNTLMLTRHVRIKYPDKKLALNLECKSV